jgi:ABC-type spermidine/putrescine transport system permease subunit I
MATAVLTVGVALPLGVLLDQSFHIGFGGGPATLQNYVSVLGQPLYTDVLGRTFLTGGLVAVASVPLGVAFAVAAMGASRKMRGVLTVIAASPLVLSVPVITFAWFELLQYRGAVADLTSLLHLGGVSLLETPLGAIFGLLYLTLPLTTVTAIIGLRRLDESLLHAARSMGAGRATVLRTVVIPHAGPSLVAGALLAFVVATGAYLIPEVLGGPQNTFVTFLVQSASIGSLSPGLAAALAIILLFLSSPALVITSLVTARLARPK